MKKESSERNKTITLSDEERQRYGKRLLTPDKLLALSDIQNKTLCGDLNRMLDYLPEAFADLIIIDPPYNLDRTFDGKKFKKRSDEAYDEYLESWFSRVIKTLKPNGTVYLCGDWRMTASLYNIMNKNLHVLNRITWQREKGRGSLSNWKNAMEDIWFAVKDAKDYYFDVEAVKVRRKVIAPYKQDGKPKDWEETPEGNFRMTYPSNFWDDISIPYWSMPENTEHPTQKPEKLIAKLILASCPEGGMVFDPFLGSGTTSVVAKKLNRNYCGIEISTDFAAIAEKRLEMADQDNSIQGYTNGVFWERNTNSLQKKKKGELIQDSIFKI
jgi:DNA modification methylase